jgi:hypothetical protein
MPQFYYQTVVNDAEGVLTGWRNGDDNRFVEVGTGIEVDPLIWSIWELDHYGAHHWELAVAVGNILPNSGGNNLPELQMRWDSDGVWRDLFVLIPGGIAGIYTSAGDTLATRPDDQSTMSFRVANIHDEIGGIFTPRSFDGLTIQLAALVTSPMGIYTQARLSLGLTLYTASPLGATVQRRARAWGKVIA